jgi:uncharacterized protein (TIGR02284 family)
MTDQIISILNDLIETSKDGEKGFSLAARSTTDVELTSVFTEAERSCQAAATELQRQVRTLGGSGEEGGSTEDVMDRGWSVQGAESGRDVVSVLEECERGEDYALARYQDALGRELPEPLRSLVQRQYQGVIANHDRVLELRDRYRASTGAREREALPR